MPVLLMLDLMLDFMLDRVHAMTHVALRASSDDDVSNLVAFARGRQRWAGEGHAGAAPVTPLSLRQISRQLSRPRSRSSLRNESWVSASMGCMRGSTLAKASGRTLGIACNIFAPVAVP